MLKLIIFYIIYWGFNFIEFMVLIECICSWLPGVTNTRFYELVTKFTAPLLSPIRNFMYKRMGNMMIDFSPMILIILLGLIQQILLAIL